MTTTISAADHAADAKRGADKKAKPTRRAITAATTSGEVQGQTNEAVTATGTIAEALTSLGKGEGPPLPANTETDVLKEVISENRREGVKTEQEEIPTEDLKGMTRSGNRGIGGTAHRGCGEPDRS